MSPVEATLPDGLPNIDVSLFDRPTGARLAGAGSSTHAPRFLMLYGSLRERSYSKLLTLEAARLLRAMGGDVRVFDPAGSRPVGRTHRGDGHARAQRAAPEGHTL